jgi:hypothetical protein
MVNQGRVLKTEKISGDSHRTQGIDKVPAGMLQVAIDLQLLTGEEEIWRPVVTHLAGMLVVVVAIQCSPSSQTPSMVWIKAGETPKCRVIVEAPVARACRRHHVEVAVADHVEAEAEAEVAVAGDSL